MLLATKKSSNELKIFLKLILLLHFYENYKGTNRIKSLGFLRINVSLVHLVGGKSSRKMVTTWNG